MSRWQNVCVGAVLVLGACQAYEPTPGPGSAGSDLPGTDIGSARAPLVGGTIDTDDPAVVALTRGDDRSFCTGTLVSPTVVLTAAHCIDMAGADPNVVIFFGSDITSGGRKFGVNAKFQHAGWTGDLADGNDIGLLLMSFPNTDVTPIPMNTAAATAFVGDPYRLVGFGIYDLLPQRADGKKRTANTVIDDVLDSPPEDEIIIADGVVTVCFGDSGGPGFVTIDGIEYVAGVHSWTNTSTNACGPPNGDTRVDLFVESDLQPWIDANDPTCQMDGICAKVGCTNDPDCTPCGPDGTCVSDCPLPDPDCPTSNLGELCQANTQCMTELCVFWRGDPDTKFCSQECELGDSSCPAGMSCQSVTPFGNICYYDEDPAGVLGDDCEQATDCGSYQCQESACVDSCDLTVGMGCPPDFECGTHNDADYFCWSSATKGGGGGICQTGGDGAPGALFILLAGLAVVGRPLRRRRRRQKN